jgi:integrase
MQVEGKAPKKAGNTPTGSSITTVSIYARALRTAFNEVISNGIVEADKYPFGLRGFSIPSGKNIKKALSTKDLEMIKNYAPEPDSMEERSRDFWLFSYYGNGMNFKDLLSLRVKDLKDTDIYFQRAKTKGKSSDATLIRVRVNAHIKMVIEKYGNKSNRPNDLIFPYLNVTETPEKQRLSIHLFITSTNKYMNRIGVKLGIKSKLDTYEARHTFATQLMRNNAPSQIIGNSMGHSNPATTANYLGSFEKEAEDSYLDML